MKKLLTDFFGADAAFDITFKVVENLTCDSLNDPNGCTKASYSYSDKKVTISIDKAYANNPQTPTLFIARTLVHEAIHANLFLAVKKLNGGVTPTNSDFGILYEQYRTKKNWQHEFMADRYVTLIASATARILSGGYLYRSPAQASAVMHLPPHACRRPPARDLPLCGRGFCVSSEVRRFQRAVCNLRQNHQDSSTTTLT